MERAYDDAKYGRFSRKPYIDIVIPSLTDPSIAPPGKHVMSCFVQYAPYHLAESNWDDQREAFGDTVVNTIAEYAPNFKSIVRHRQVVTPLDLEREWGLSEGNIFQGELSLEQLFFLRPVAGWANYRTPIDGLVMCGSATHPGGRHHGRPWPQRGAGGAEGREGLMAARYDVAVIGGGHNGLVAAAYLARSGRKVVVLESRDEIGGCAITREIAPGFRVPSLTHSLSIDPQVASDLGLAAQGLHLLQPPVSVFAPTDDGRAFAAWRDEAATAHELASWSPADAANWPEFAAAARMAAGAIGGLMRQIPPSLDSPSAGDLIELLKTGRTLRKMGRQGLYRFLRWGPMPIGDLVSEWIETPVARAVVCARGVFGTTAGPRSAGTSATWLLQAALEGSPVGAPTFAVGGPGSLAAALAVKARSAGADIRLNARVAGIATSDEGVTGVVLDSGETIDARAVVSSADPKHTLLGLVDPIRLRAVLPREDSPDPRPRDAREGQPRPVGAAGVSRHDRTVGAGGHAAERAHPHRPDARVPRARVRSLEVRRVVVGAVARSGDPVVDGFGAGACRPARDVHLRAVDAGTRFADATGIASATRSATSSCGRSTGTRQACRRRSSRVRC